MWCYRPIIFFKYSISVLCCAADCFELVHFSKPLLALSCRDASWELEDNAYAELLQVYQHCDAFTCQSSLGRDFSAQSGWVCSNISVYTREDLQGQSFSLTPTLLLVHLDWRYPTIYCTSGDNKFTATWMLHSFKVREHQFLSATGTKPKAECCG